MKKHIYLSVLMLFSLGISIPVTYGQSSLSWKNANNSGAWKTQSVTLMTDLPDFTPLTEKGNTNKYGSTLDVKEEATGFFYTKKIGDRWWLIDPEGYGHVNVAMNSVYNLTGDEIPTMYDRFLELGYNGIGNFLNNENQTKTYNEGQEDDEEIFSYTRRINFFLTYKDRRRGYYPTMPAQLSGNVNYVFVLDPKFEDYCDELAQKLVLPYKDEPGLIGYFLDNEISFNQDQLANLLVNGGLKAGDPSYDAALKFITDKGFTIADLNPGGFIGDKVKAEFATMLAEHYFKVTDAAIRKYDPNHLNFGSRLHGRPRDIEGVVKASAKYCDVVSVNFYDRFNPDDQITSPNAWMKWIDKPCAVTEFYTKGDDAKEGGLVTGTSGAGYVVKTQTERGYFYQNTCLQLLKSKKYVGWHYFKMQDDGDSNKGIVSTTAKGRNEYTELTSQMRDLNINVYKLIEYFDSLTSDMDGLAEDEAVVYAIDGILGVVNLTENARLRIVDMSGKCVFQDSISGDATFSLGGLSSGVYIVTLSGDKWNRTVKIVL